jgi:hypothetical protein
LPPVLVLTLVNATGKDVTKADTAALYICDVIKTASHSSYLKTKKSIVMKKIKTVLTAIVMLLSATAFAMEPENVSPKVKAAFQTNFSSASKVSWEKTSDFYFVTFQLNNSNITAAYNEEGELVGTARRIEAGQLPLNVSLAISEKYAGLEMEKSATELTYEGQTRYYINGESKTHVLKLKCNASGEISVESRIKK